MIHKLKFCFQINISINCHKYLMNDIIVLKQILLQLFFLLISNILLYTYSIEFELEE